MSTEMSTAMSTVSIYIAGAASPLTVQVPTWQAQQMLTYLNSNWSNYATSSLVAIPNTAINWAEVVLVTVS